MLDFGTLQSNTEEIALARLAQQTFNFPESYYATWFERMGRECHRVVRQEGALCGGLAIYETEQWFGGRAMPIGGVAMVCVDPSLRRQGVGQHLLKKTLSELRDRGVPFATLFPSTLRAYRKLGFEQAGSWYTQQHALVPADAPSELLPMHRVDSLRAEPFSALASRRACRTEGNLRRNEPLWQRLFDARGNPTPVRGYLIGEESAPDGYVIYLQDRVAGTPSEDRLIVKDMVAETHLAAQTLWSFLHGHCSTVSSCIWSGSAVDPLLLLPTECEPKVLSARRWMSRVTDVRRALEARGYRCPASLQLDLQVEDAVLPQNSGRYRLTVEEGRGQVASGGQGDLQIDIRGLASLFTGFCSAYALRIAGRLDGNDRTLSTADQIFAGADPWMPEYF